MRAGVTVVLTSCRRPELLRPSISSFIAFNTFEISKFILVEDGPSLPDFLKGLKFPFPTQFISTGRRVGQIAAIDYAYSHVDTEFVFHTEDDWEFFQPGFIEKSLKVLCEQDRCLQVWLRAHNDTNGHPICRKIFQSDGVRWQKLKYDYLKTWHGFSFNPGLRRMRDYREIGGYGIHTLGQPVWTDEHGPREATIAKLYREKGMFAAILSDPNDAGYVKHIGWDRTISDKPIDRTR